MKFNKIFNYFSKGEWFLYLTSVLTIFISFFAFKSSDYITLIASLIGVTSLIFNAKGNPLGQVLMVIFSLLYGIISFGFSYYGEMITYLGMTMPMAVLSLISWLKHPYKHNKSQVEISSINLRDTLFMLLLTLIVTVIFYFILYYYKTANLFFSTLSVATSFIAVFLTFKRSPFFNLAYACNDIVLIVLWLLASISDRSYFSVVVCFIVFLINDTYGFMSWLKMKKIQQQ